MSATVENTANVENVESTSAEVSSETLAAKELKASEIINRNLVWAAGGGLIIIPFVDIAAVTAVQIKMVRELCDLYDVRFSKKLVRTTLASILSGFGSSYLAYGGVGSLTAASLSKFVPVVGTAFGVTAMAVFATAFTYGVGKYFTRHFAAGGTLESVNEEEATAEVKNLTEDYIKEQEKKSEKIEKDLSGLNNKLDRLENKLSQLVDKLSKDKK